MFRVLQTVRFWFPLTCLLGYCWFALINQLRVEWSVNPQYSYSWVVPFLCLGLLLRRWQGFRENGNEKVESRNELQISASRHFSVSAFAFRFQISAFQMSAFCFCLLAFLYLPTRLIQEANPEWRLISWALAIEVVGLTMLTVRLAFGGKCLWQVAFPICFFLVAVPWPIRIVQVHFALDLCNVHCASFSSFVHRRPAKANWSFAAALPEQKSWRY